MRREPHVLFDNGTHQCLLFDDLVEPFPGGAEDLDLCMGIPGWERRIDFFCSKMGLSRLEGGPVFSGQAQIFCHCSLWNIIHYTKYEFVLKVTGRRH